MARAVKTKEISTLQSWDDVDLALEGMCEIDIMIKREETKLNDAIKTATAESLLITAPMRATRDFHEAQIKLYVTQNKAAMENQSKKLNFGMIKLRRSSRLNIRNTEHTLNLLKEQHMYECIKEVEQIDKEALEKYPDTELGKVGASRTYSESITVTPDWEALR